jgi:hypothetical protein
MSTPSGQCRGRSGNIFGLVIDGGVEPKLGDVAACMRSAGDSDNAAAFDFCDLSDRRADDTGAKRRQL